MDINIGVKIAFCRKNRPTPFYVLSYLKIVIEKIVKLNYYGVVRDKFLSVILLRLFLTFHIFISFLTFMNIAPLTDRANFFHNHFEFFLFPKGFIYHRKSSGNYFSPIFKFAGLIINFFGFIFPIFHFPCCMRKI